MYFDGGFRGKLGDKTGAISWVAYDSEGCQIEGIGCYYGNTIQSNNEAEACALHGAVCFVETNVARFKASNVRILGDSLLLINHLRRRSRSSTAMIASTIREVRQKLWRLPLKAAVDFVPRE